jgi:hypothetical protein
VAAVIKETTLYLRRHLVLEPWRTEGPGAGLEQPSSSAPGDRSPPPTPVVVSEEADTDPVAAQDLRPEADRDAPGQPAGGEHQPANGEPGDEPELEPQSPARAR